MHALLRASYRWCGLQISGLSRRSASTTNSNLSANPYPYPSNSNPTPHQIFHLPLSASQKEVKSRYYELVRIYHPDSPIARAYPPEVSEVRFHAISVSYDVLRGRRATLDCGSPDTTSHPRVDLHALWRAKQHHRQDPMGPPDDRWKDGIILGSLVLALGALIYQIAASRQKTVLQISRRSGAEEGRGSASEQSRDVQFLTAPNSDSPDITPPPPR
ncbi:hypothetical protein BJV74DRAFT_830435 [Russula compacta]|nr:hypothetical protein BJV74DRAFT_830435 [Russula compacta]